MRARLDLWVLDWTRRNARSHPFLVQFSPVCPRCLRRFWPGFKQCNLSCFRYW